MDISDKIRSITMINKAAAKRLLLIVLTGISIILIFLFAAASVTGYYFYTQAKTFSEHSGLSFSEIHSLGTAVWNKSPVTTNGYTNILVLGVDSLESRGSVPPLTDTILIASVNTRSGEINTLSLPRDLWSEEYQTKINALYFYGQERYPERPEQFTKEVLEEMLGLQMHHTIVITMDSLADMVDLLGGIEVDVPTGFVDNKFPRPDVDVAVERDPEVLYKTVTFEPGKQIMNGEQVLEYVRSRNSEGDEGHDLARTGRQQYVLNALLAKILSRSTLTNPALMGDLFSYYHREYNHYLSILEAGSLAKKLVPSRDTIAIIPNSLSTYPEMVDGVLWNPPLTRAQPQWIYSIRDQESLRNEVELLLFKTYLSDRTGQNDTTALQ